MSSGPDAFWLCHECGAQMRPITRDGITHCASCDGEFLEIVDSNVNPDPFHELPPPPPVRPHDNQPSGSSPPDSPGAGAEGGFMQSLFGSLFGAAAANPAPSDRRVGSPSGSSQGDNGARMFTFNIGGGRGSVTFGSLNGGQMNAFGGGGPDGGLESFFPGFGPPAGAGGPRNGPQLRDVDGRPLGPTDPMGPEDLIRALFSVIAEDGGPPLMGIPGQANLGDYVMTDQGFDNILERLMHAAGPQGPIPATEAVIEGLPRITFTGETLEKSPFKDCPVCKDDFSVGDEVMRVPCQHVFHPDCLQPWLRVNGSCPVCRFSLVPEEGTRPPQPSVPGSQQASSPPPAEGGPSTVTNILQRLWGQGGTSNPTSPATDARPAPLYPETTEQATSTSISTPSASSSSQQDPPQSHSNSENAPSLSSGIPSDYRERHRQREQQQQQQQQHQEPTHDDLD